MRRLLVALTLLGAATVPGAAHASAAHWVGAWAASPQSGGPGGRDQSYRLMVHTSTGGSSLRLRFTNRYGTEPLTLRDVSVALPVSPVRADVIGVRHVRFRSGDDVTIPAGAEAVSLPTRFSVPADAWLAVSFYAPGPHAATTFHDRAWGVNFQTSEGSGDHAADTSGSSFVVPSFSWTYLTEIDVTARRSVSTVVAFGDSITDFMESVPEGNTRWPDLLDRRFRAVPGGQRFSVVNAGINGNEVTEDNGGTAALGQAGVTRMAWDVFRTPGVSTVILVLGVNDIGRGVAPARIEAAYRTVVSAAHRRGIRVLISTVTPTAGTAAGHLTYGTLAGSRDEVNAWILTHARLFDGVLHFGEVVQDPVTKQLWNPAYTAGDQTHPNPLGLQAMADSIPLELFP